MSVYIRGMKMPNRCFACSMCDVSDGVRFFCGLSQCSYIEYRDIDLDVAVNTRPDWCPLIELPPHGRLIDADELVKRWTAPPEYYPDDYSKSVYDNGKLMVKDFRASVIDAPTIIPASEEVKE